MRPQRRQPTRSPVPGVLQARTLEWVAISFSNAWKWGHSVVSDPQWPHGLQPTRLLHPWDFPGKSTGVGCHCLLLSLLYAQFKKKKNGTVNRGQFPWLLWLQDGWFFTLNQLLLYLIQCNKIPLYKIGSPMTFFKMGLLSVLCFENPFKGRVLFMRENFFDLKSAVQCQCVLRKYLHKCFND